MRAALLLTASLLLALPGPAIAQKGPGNSPAGPSAPAQQSSVPASAIAAVERHNAAAETAFRQSDFRTATREFEAAFLIYNQHLGLESAHTAVAAANMGMAMLGQGRFDDALQALEAADTILARVDSGHSRRPGIQRAIEMARTRQDLGAPAQAAPAQPAPQGGSASGSAGGSGSIGAQNSSAVAISDVAVAAFDAGDYAQAEAGFLHALQVHESAGTHTSEGAGVVWVNLGEVYSQTSRLAEAENALARARAIFEALSPSHRYLAVVENNLTSVRRRQGGPEAALPGYQSVLERMRATFGDDHPNTATAMGNLASAYLSLGRPAEARPLLESALAIEVAAFGEGTPESADTVSGLGQAYLDLGRYEDAITFQRRALGALEGASTANPRHIATMRQRLGRALQRAGRASEAETVLTQALTESEAAFGPGTGEAITAISFLASAVFDQARFQEAESLQRRALSEAASLGDGDREATIASLESNLAGSVRMLGRLDEAEALYRRSLEQAERGGRPLDIAMSLENLAGSVRVQGRLDEAATLQVRALALYRETLGADHPESVRAFANAGTTLGLAGDHDGAQTLMREGLDGLQGRVPETHTALLVARANLAWLYLRHMNRAGEALDLYRTASGSIIRAAVDAGQSSSGDAASSALILRRNDMFQLHTEAAWAAAHHEG